MIAGDVVIELVNPERAPALGLIGVSAPGVPVPETAVDEERDPQFREYEIWCSREVSRV
jgi:hypothetical protein